MKKLNVHLYLIAAFTMFTADFAVSAPKGDLEKIKAIYEMIKEFPSKLRLAPTYNSKQAFGTAKKTKVIFVDVRKNKEMKISMIKGAISEDDFEKNMDKYKGHIIIPYCTIGYRSAEYTNELKAKGHKAFNLEGGVLLWAFAGYNVYDNKDKITFNVHVYGKQWDLLPENYKGIW